jgi:hypothetical protein
MSRKNLKKKVPSRSSPTNHNILSLNTKLHLYPIIFIVSILPFITRYYQYDTGLSIFNWFSRDDSHHDMFLYNKKIWFLIMITIMVSIMAYNLIQKKLKLKINVSFVPLIIYAVLAILSAILSDYSSFSYKGIFEHFESLFVLLGYFIVVYYIYLFIDNSASVDFIFKYFTISIISFSILGLSQLIGHDLLLTELGKKLILPVEYWSQLDKFDIGFRNVIYLTLYNPNYVGVYTAFLIPIFISLLITSKVRKDIITKLITITGLVICLVGSGSKAGIIGLIISLFFVLLLLRKYFFKKYFKIITISLLLITSVLLISNYSNIKSILTPRTNITPPLSDITTDENIVITYNDNQLFIDYEITAENELVYNFTDGNGKDVPYVINSNDNSIAITDERFPNFYVSISIQDKQLYTSVITNNQNWVFTKLEDGTFYYINNYGKPDKIVTAKSSIFTNYENFASGRGYIWSRTIPLLKDYIVLGSGPDTFSIVYPQQDYVNLSNYGFGNQVLTKPHSLYLQIGVQTGVLSLISFLIFYLMYFMNSIKLYINGNFNTDMEYYGVAIFIGTISYMVTGISNDSSITVSPIFWALIGIGIAINHKISLTKKESLQ